MRTSCLACLALLLSTVTVAVAHADDRPRRYFTLVNTAHEAVVAVDVGDRATLPAEAVQRLPLDAPLHGGGNSVVLHLPAGSCQRDLRMTLKDGRTVLYPRIDTCRSSGLRIRARDLSSAASP